MSGINCGTGFDPGAPSSIRYFKSLVDLEHQFLFRNGWEATRDGSDGSPEPRQHYLHRCPSTPTCNVRECQECKSTKARPKHTLARFHSNRDAEGGCIKQAWDILPVWILAVFSSASLKRHNAIALFFNDGLQKDPVLVLGSVVCTCLRL